MRIWSSAIVPCAKFKRGNKQRVCATYSNEWPTPGSCRIEYLWSSSPVPGISTEISTIAVVVDEV